MVSWLALRSLHTSLAQVLHLGLKLIMSRLHFILKLD